MLKDCCAVADNAVLPPETVVPPFTLYAGSPGDVELSLSDQEYNASGLHGLLLPPTQRYCGEGGIVFGSVCFWVCLTLSACQRDNS